MDYRQTPGTSLRARARETQLGVSLIISPPNSPVSGRFKGRHQVPDRVRGAGGRPAPIMSRTGSSRPAAESTMNTTWWMCEPVPRRLLTDEEI